MAYIVYRHPRGSQVAHFTIHSAVRVDLQTRASRHGRLWKVRLYRTFRWARGHHRMVPPEVMER